MHHPGLRVTKGLVGRARVTDATCGGMVRNACIMWFAICRLLEYPMLWATLGRITNGGHRSEACHRTPRRSAVGGDAVVVAAQHQTGHSHLEGIDDRQLRGQSR